MKANARKILALIMAMVMCLSLAAPALAADASGNEGVTLSTQAVTYTIEAPDDGSGDYKIYDSSHNLKRAGNVKDSTPPDGVTVKLKTAAVDKIGVAGGVAEYTVSYKDPDDSNTADPVPVKFGKAGAKKSIEDVKDSEWQDLSTIGELFTVGSTKYQVKGSVYQEKQGSTGLVLTYFKLAVVENKAFKDGETLYFVNTTERATVKSAADMDTALAGAKKCNSYGVTTSDNIIDAKCCIEAGTGEVEAESHYGFVATNGSGLTATGTAGTDLVDGAVSLTFDTDVTTGSFQVSVKDNTKTKKEKKDIYVTSAEDAQKVLEKVLTGDEATIESVTAASGNFFTVTVKAVAKNDAYTPGSTSLYAKNVTYYTISGKNEPVLVDQTAGGFYKASTKEGSNAKTLAANTETLGEVVVRKSDIPTSYTPTGAFTPAGGGDYYVFNSVKDVKFTTTVCKDAKAVPYVQIVVNPWIGDKQNALVDKIEKKVSDKSLVSDVFTHSVFTQVQKTATWYEDAYLAANAAFVKKGTVDVKAANHSNLVDTYTTTPPTCQTPGSKTTKTLCGVCNQVVAEKTEEIPVDSSPVAKNTSVKVKDANTEDVDKIWFESGVDAVPAGSTHYIKKAETTTTLSEDKSATIVTTTFTCNYGVVHEELTRVVTVKKADLQHAGKWNIFKLGDRSSRIFDFDDVSNMFGYTTLTIVDSDVDNEALAMNRKLADIPNTNLRDTDTNGDLRFTFTGFTAADKNDDGSYTQYSNPLTLKNVYTSATALPTSKTYVAKVTAKDIVKPTADCQPSSATLEAEVYEVNTDKAYMTAGQPTTAISGADNFEKNLAKGYVTLKSQYSEAIQNRAVSNHSYDQVTGICRFCNKGREVVQDRTFTADTVTVEDLKWTGTVAQPKVVVKDSEGYILVKGVDYIVSEIDSADVGTYTITIKGVNDYDGNRVNKTFKIVAPAEAEKKAQPMKLSVTKKTLKVKNLKKKAATVKVKVTSTKGKVTYKASKGLSVKKSGKTYTVTVKKGTKKGKYTVKWTAKGNTGYKKGSKTLTITVK